MEDANVRKSLLWYMITDNEGHEGKNNLWGLCGTIHCNGKKRENILMREE